jgi:putative SOS response-associated peptidase YedK
LAKKANANLSLTLESLEPNYNIAPSLKVPVIYQKTERVLDLLKWGLVPESAKESCYIAI